MMTLFRLSWRLLLNEWRAGELRTVGWAVVIAVAAVVFTDSAADRVHRSLVADSHALLAADLRIEGREPIPKLWIERAQQSGLQVARVVSFPTAVLKGLDSVLVSVKAVEDDYPLRGSLQSSGSDGAALPGVGEVWVERRLLELLSAEEGETLAIGNSELRIARVLISEPDQSGQFFDLAPRLLMRFDELERSGLIAPGSRARYLLLVAGEDGAVAAYGDWLETLMPPTARLLTPEQASGRIGNVMDRARSFIDLVVISTLLLAGIAVLVAGERFSRRHEDGVALLRCFGASRVRAVGAYFGMLALLGAAAALCGLFFGILGQAVAAFFLEQVLQRELLPPSYPLLLKSGISVYLLTLVFALPALVRLHGIPPMRLLSEGGAQYRPRALVAYFIPFAALVVLILLGAASAQLALLTILGIFAAIGALLLMSLLLLWVARALFARASGTWRLGLAALFRDRVGTIMNISALGVGMTAILLLVLVRAQLFERWQSELPADAPNHFLLNIQPAQRAGVQRWLAENLDGSRVPPLYPIATGRLVHINGEVPLGDRYDDPQARGRIEGVINLSWSAALPSGNELAAGSWWPATTQAADQVQAEVSLARSWADSLALSVGDMLDFQVADELVSARVTSIRSVEWDSFEVNFFVLFRPGSFNAAGRSYLASLHVPASQQATIARIAGQYPNINVINVGQVIGRVRDILGSISLALNALFLFVVAAGVSVLIAILKSSTTARVKDIAVMKTLGARHRQLLGAARIEVVTLGLLAGIVSSAAATLIGLVLARLVFKLPYTPDPLLWLLGIAVSVLLVVAISHRSLKATLSTAPRSSIH